MVSLLVKFSVLFMLTLNIATASLLPVVNYLGYYCVSIEIGTPPQQILLIIDTSSSHTYLNPPDAQHTDSNEYRYIKDASSTFEWLTCMDEEFCTVCLGNAVHNGCAYHFAEQMYVMAKDIMHLNDYHNSDSYDSSNDNYFDEHNYLMFGYNTEDQQINTESYAFQVHSNMQHGGILALNRRRTSFVQQMYIQNEMNRKFAHYFNGDGGMIAFGDDVDSLIEHLNIENDDIWWIPYWNQMRSSMYQAMYQVDLEQVTLNNGDAVEIVFEGDGNLNGNLNILTFDTGITGISMNHEWRDIVLNYIVNQSDVSLVSNVYYPYCIDTDIDDVLDDIYNKLPDINIRLSANMMYIVSPQQYIININDNNIHYQFCLDISFEEDDSICLGSHVMQNYLIIYNDDDEMIGIYDTNLNHQSQQNDLDSLEIAEEEKKYVYALSLALVGILICLLLTSALCVVLLGKITKTKEINIAGNIPKWNNQRRNSVTIDELSSPKKSLSPQRIAINAINRKQQQHLELDSSHSGKDVNISVSSSLSPFKYYDGNIKSIVYDRIIQPWSLEEEMDAI